MFNNNQQHNNSMPNVGMWTNNNNRMFNQQQPQQLNWNNNTAMEAYTNGRRENRSQRSENFSNNQTRRGATMLTEAARLDEDFERARANLRMQSKFPMNLPSVESTVDRVRYNLDEEELLRAQRRLLRSPARRSSEHNLRRLGRGSTPIRRSISSSQSRRNIKHQSPKTARWLGNSSNARWSPTSSRRSRNVTPLRHSRNDSLVRRRSRNVSPTRIRNARSRNLSPARARVDRHGASPLRARKRTYSSTVGEKKNPIITVILTAKDPQVVISQQKLSRLSEALIAEFTTGYDVKPKFHGIYFKTNKLLLDCETQETVEWIRRAVPQLKKWDGPELDIIVGKNNKNVKSVEIYLPRSAGEDAKSVLSIIEAQNDGISTSSWLITRDKISGRGKILQLTISNDSWDAISKLNCSLYYRFGKVQVTDLSKNRRLKSPSHSDSIRRK